MREKWKNNRDAFWRPGSKRREVKPAFSLPVYETDHYDLVRWFRYNNRIVLIHEPFENLRGHVIGASYFDGKGEAWIW